MRLAWTYRIYMMVIVTMAVACGMSEEEIDAQAKAIFDRRIETLKAEKEQECRQEINRKAEIIVDSLIRELRINPLNETLYKPKIPERPEFIEVDSSVFNSKHSVKPIPK